MGFSARVNMILEVYHDGCAALRRDALDALYELDAEELDGVTPEVAINYLPQDEEEEKRVREAWRRLRGARA